MITKNYKKCMGGILAAGSTRYIPVTTVSGSRVYTGLAKNITGAWPKSDFTNSCTLDPGAAGISVGSGTSPETDDSYQLGSTITSGLSLSASASYSLDQNENPILTRLITVTNTSNAAITVAEIGFKIVISSSSNVVILVDRTLLETPITIQPSASATITYEIKFIWNNG